jgi:hypothetical protein
MHPGKGKKTGATPITKVQEKLPNKTLPAFLHRAAPRAQPLGRAGLENGWDAVAVFTSRHSASWGYPTA